MTGPGAHRTVPRRFTFVVVRYGEGILGGAEAHCRAVVERLAAQGHDVRVLTTTATSYKSWRNALSVGEERVAGIPVRRFATRIPRLTPFDDALKWAVTLGREGAGGLAQLRRFDAAKPDAQALHLALERAWIAAQGPVAPDLIDAIARTDTDAFVFFGYLYYPTIWGVPRVAERAVIAPLADEEPMLYAPIVRRTLRSARALVMNVDEEAERVRAILAPQQVPMAVVALGMDPAPARAAYARPVDGPFLLLLGRGGKNRPMAPVWRALIERRDLGAIELDDGRTLDATALTLVTAGERTRSLEGHPRVVQLGRVDEATRWGLTRDALALVSPSVSESLSLVVLESWLAGRSVIVNRACDTTDGHVRRCAGGVSIDFTPPSAAALAIVDAIRHKRTRDDRAAKGKAYVERRYGWDRVLDAYGSIGQAIATRDDVNATLRRWAAQSGAWFAGAAG